MIRFFDILLSVILLLVLLPLLLMISAVILLNSRGGIFFRQWRVGKGGKEFRLIKFRTMRPGSQQNGNLTLGDRDPRITGPGYLLRKYKLDELPQLFNVLAGEMSFVGPRPDLREFTDHYTEDQKIILTVKPGITDYASIEYFDEPEILGRSAEPLKTYLEEVMPAKIELNKKFIENPGLKEYFTILWKTGRRIFR